MISLEMIPLVFGIAVPIVLAAIGGTFSSQVNVFNVGLEGMMLAGAFTAFLASDMTGNVVLGFISGAGAGILSAMILAVIIITLDADEIVAGIAFNLAILGLTATLLSVVYGTQGAARSDQAGLDGDFKFLIDGPLGRLDFVMIVMIVLVAFSSFFSAYTSHGLRMRAIGSSVASADAAGVSVAGYKYLAFAIGGALCGIGGAYLPLASLSIYSNNMTSGLGFIALAAVIMSAGRPMVAAAAGLLFAVASAVAIQLQASGLPTEIVLAMPYFVAIFAIAWRTVVQQQHSQRVKSARNVHDD